MPPLVIAAAVTAASTIAATVYSAKSSGSANKSAAASEQSAIDKQLAYEREKEAERKAEYDREQAEAKVQWDAEQARLDEDRAYNRSLDAGTVAQRQAAFDFQKQQYADRQAQMAPYRQAGAGALAQLAQLAGISGGTTAAAPTVLATMPANWQPGDPVTTGASASGGASSSSLLDNPNLLPTSLTSSGTKVETATPDVSAPVSAEAPAPVAPEAAPVSAFRDVSTQLLASEAPAEAFTPAQVELFRRAQVKKPSLADLARARKVRA